MRFTDRLIDRQRKNYLDKEREADKQQEENQEDETGMAYQPRAHIGFINDSSSIFDAKSAKGINTEPSIFDKTAIFKVTRDEEEET